MLKVKDILRNLFILVTSLTILLGSFDLVKADVLEGNDGSTMQITSDEGYLYITYDGAYNNYLSSVINVDVPGANLNQFSQIIINQNNASEISDLVVLNSWYQAIDGASGVVANSDGRMSYTIMVPWSTYDSFSPEEVIITWPATGQSVRLPYQGVTELPVDPEEPENPENPEEPENPDEPSVPDPSIDPGDLVGGDIQVDGYFMDWEGYPTTSIGYGNTNDNANHHAQIVVQGDSLYVHVKMSDLYGSQMQCQQWNISINGGSSIPLEIWGVDDSGKINWSSPNGQGIHNNLGVFLNYNRDTLTGNAAMTIYENNHSQGDEIEFSVDINAIADAFGISREEIRTITLNNPNIGSASITVAGTSTGPFIGIAITLLASVAAYFIITRKSKREIKEC